MAGQQAAVEVFCSYAPEDEEWLGKSAHDASRGHGTIGEQAGNRYPPP